MHTIIDIFKALIEEPHKLTRAILAVLHGLFGVFLSIALYQVFHQKVSIHEISEWVFWRDWVLTGKVLISLFLFLFSYWLLFRFLALLTVTPLESWACRPWQLRRDSKQLVTFMLRVLNRIGLVDYDKRTDHLKGGRRTGDLVAFLEALEPSTDAGEDSEVAFSSYLQGWHLYLCFSVYYFCSPLKTGHSGFSVLVGAGCIVLPATYVWAMQLFYFISDRRQQFLFVARGLLFDEEVKAALRLQGYQLTEQRSAEGEYGRVLRYQGQEHRYFVFWIRGELTPQLMPDVLKHRMPSEGRLLMITNETPGPGVAEQIDAYQGRLTLLVIPTAADIPQVVQTVFRKGKASSYAI